MRNLSFALAALSLSTSHICSADPAEPGDGAAASTALVDLAGAAPVVTQPKRLDVSGAKSILLASREAPFELVQWPPDATPDQQLQVALVRVNGLVKGQIDEATTQVVNGVVKFNGEKRKALALIASLYTVNAQGKPDKPVFAASNLKELLEQPSGDGSLVDVLGERASQMMAVKKDLVAEAKND